MDPPSPVRPGEDGAPEVRSQKPTSKCDATGTRAFIHRIEKVHGAAPGYNDLVCGVCVGMDGPTFALEAGRRWGT